MTGALIIVAKQFFKLMKLDPVPQTILKTGLPLSHTINKQYFT